MHKKFLNARVIGLLILAVLFLSLSAILLFRRQPPNQPKTQHPATQQPQATATQPPVTSARYPNFKGIIEFSGKNSSTDAANPHLAGVALGYWWSQIEPTEGHYNWNIIDQDMAPWVAHDKTVILRISSAGHTSWFPPYSQKATPAWVYSLGVKSVKETDGAIYPEYWNPLYLQKLHDLVQAFGQHYDGNPHVAFVEIGLGVGGEAKADDESNPNILSLWQSIGYTDQRYWNALQSIIGSYQQAFHNLPLVVMPDKVFLGKTAGYNEALLLNYTVQRHLWLQDNSLGTNRTLAPQFMQVPHVGEQLKATQYTNDTLQSDIQAGLDLGANYILVFIQDIHNPDNQNTLKWASSLVPHANK